MRKFGLLLCLALTSFAARAQAPAKQHCSIQPSRALTDADAAYAAGNPTSAESLWSTQLAASPSVTVYAGIIRSQLQQDKLEEALATSKSLIAAFPNASDSYAYAGDVLIRVGHIPEASLAFSKALSLDQCSPRAHLGWGRVSGILSHHTAEAHELAAAHALSPSDPEITSAWLEIQPPAQRAVALETLLASHPNLPPDHVARLSTELAILQQHKLCLPVEPIANARFDLQPIPYLGRYTRSWALKIAVNADTIPLVELDSSVSGIVLNPKDALKAGVHPIGPTPTSPNALYTALADTIRIGSVEFHDCPVRVAPAEALANANSVIGTDFFRANIIHLDYVAQTLALTPLPPPPAAGPIPDAFIPADEKDWTPVYVTGNTMLLPTLIDKKGPFLFIIDTGTYSAILSPTITKHLLIASSDATVNRAGTSAGIVKVLPREGGVNTDRADIVGPDGKLLKVTRPLKLPVLRFAKAEFADDSTLSFDLTPLSHATGIEVSGFLGFRLLSMFSFDLDYRDGLANIAFDQNRRYAVHQADKEVLGNPF